MDLTESQVTLAVYIKTWLEEGKAALGLKAIYYGDQSKIPVTPTVCIEPGTKRRDEPNPTRMAEVRMECILLVYLMRIDSVQTTREEVDTVAELVEAYLHTRPQLDGLAIHSYVTSLESGYSERGNTLFRTARITFEARSKVRLPLGGV